MSTGRIAGAVIGITQPAVRETCQLEGHAVRRGALRTCRGNLLAQFLPLKLGGDRAQRSEGQHQIFRLGSEHGLIAVRRGADVRVRGDAPFDQFFPDFDLPSGVSRKFPGFKSR
ncbi:MAG TPA: hypothetical protein VEI49_01235 [Terriglobales bacterium]|nr:hypothetical protein [Terriglobales bacterium]